MERHLDAHCEAILQEYRDNLELITAEGEKVFKSLSETLSKAGIVVAALEHRIKTEDSLAGKLEIKGAKYKSLASITDIIGLRIITFYSADVDKVASAVERLFDVDWENSVDKRKLLEIDSFGYLSLHYVCSEPGFPYKFEIQMRTLLQHAWANMNHDTGYKSGVEIPVHFRRSMSRIAGLLELVDEQFSIMRSEMADYRRRMQSLMTSGKLEDVPLDGETYRSFLNVYPFKRLLANIASINQAEILDVPLMPYLEAFKALGFKTLGDLDRLIKDYSDAAFQIASYQMGLTDLDIISSSIAPQNLCIAYILMNGGGKGGLKYLFDTINGPSPSNEDMAQYMMEETAELPFMNQK